MGVVAQAIGNQQGTPPAGVGAGNVASGQWGADKVLGTARMLAFEIMYSDGGGKALEDRLAGSQDVPGDVADIVGNVLFATQQKARANGRMIPDDTVQKLAMVLVFEVLNVASIMGVVGKGDTKQMAKQILPAAMQVYAATGSGQQQPQGQPQPAQGGLVNQAMQGGA